MFICKGCHTQFASPQVVHSWIISNSLSNMCVNLSPPYFNLNVRPQQHLYGTSLITLVSCAGCNMLMGFKRIPESDPNHVNLQGLVALYLSWLCYRNGEATFSLMEPCPMDPLPLPPPHPHGPPFFVCKACNTHVAWKKRMITMNIEHRMFFFSECIQLAVDPPEYHWILDTSTVAYVKCGGCNAVLGMKIVREDDPFYGFQQENIGLYMTRLKIWNGIDFNVLSVMERLPTPGQMPDHESLSSPS